MAENRIRLGPFALKLIAKHGPKGGTPDGKALDDILLKAFADGAALDPSLSRLIAQALEELPDWDDYKTSLIDRVYVGVDGIGNESLDSFDKLNTRVDALEENLLIAVRNTVALGKKIDALTALVEALPQRGEDQMPF